VAAGAVARRILGPDVTIRGAVVQVGPHRIDYERWDWDEIDRNDFYGPDAQTAENWATFLDETRKAGSSAGAIVEIHARGVPAGWGAPVYDRLDADIAKALMSINAAKGVEIGAGFDAVWMDGSESADEMRMGADGRPVFTTNYAGGVLGGISSGQDIVARVAFKPTSSLPAARATVDNKGHDVEISTKGRHDPCVGIRGTAVAEAMIACVLADHYLRHKAQCS
jgi:chorismate synthase